MTRASKSFVEKKTGGNANRSNGRKRPNAPHRT